MANSIYFNDIRICRASNTIFEIMYTKLKEMYIRKKINNARIFVLIDSLDQETYGYGCVSCKIDQFFKFREDYVIFANMLLEVINSIPNEYGISEESGIIERIKEFHLHLSQLINSNESIGSTGSHE